jgi:cytochrome c-type biogenesis protein
MLVELAVAFFAGIVSFASPCILPIVPGFLAYLAGVTSSTKEGSGRWQIFLNSLFFVLGFAVVFSVVGILLSTVLSHVAYDAQIWLARIGGTVIIFFGLYLSGLLKLDFLEKERKFQVKSKFNSKYLTSFVFGAAFAVGWTPCVGAVLGSILGLAASQPASAFALLLAYTIGLGVPFLLVGLFTQQASAFIQKYAKWFGYLQVAFGVILIGLGILVFTQRLPELANLAPVQQILGGNG